MQDVEINEALKREVIQTSMDVIKLAKKGINIPFYNIIEMKEILLKQQNQARYEPLDLFHKRISYNTLGQI